MRRRILVFAIAAFASCRGPVSTPPAAPLSPSVSAPLGAVVPEAAVAGLSLEHAFEGVAARLEPSVVAITATLRAPEVGAVGSLDPLDDFLSDVLNPHRSQVVHGLGSGFVLDDRGHILTNNHVVAGAEEVSVRFNDKRVLRAKVVGCDPHTDIAVIRVDARRLVPVNIGDSDDVQVGQWVVAVGSPYGLEHTVTAGIISAKGRANVGIADYEDFMQTDAAINQGNSGGPLVNMKGEVIGINTAILSRTGGSQGIGFAIPINMVKVVFEQLIERGRVTRGWMGVAIQELTPDLAKTFSFSDRGILVAEVLPGSPASRAGLESGDIIVAIGGHDTADVSAFRNRIAQTKPGSRTSVDLVREGRPRQLTVKVAELPQQEVEKPLAARGVDGNNRLGFRLMDASPELREKLQLDATTPGAVVVAVSPDSMAFEAGLRPGQLVVEIDHRAVESASGAAELLAKAGTRKPVLLRVSDAGGTRFLVLPPSSRR